MIIVITLLVTLGSTALGLILVCMVQKTAEMKVIASTIVIIAIVFILFGIKNRTVYL